MTRQVCIFLKENNQRLKRQLPQAPSASARLFLCTSMSTLNPFLSLSLSFSPSHRQSPLSCSNLAVKASRRAGTQAQAPGFRGGSDGARNPGSKSDQSQRSDWRPLYFSRPALLSNCLCILRRPARQISDRTMLVVGHCPFLRLQLLAVGGLFSLPPDERHSFTFRIFAW